MADPGLPREERIQLLYEMRVPMPEEIEEQLDRFRRSLDYMNGYLPRTNLTALAQNALVTFGNTATELMGVTAMFLTAGYMNNRIRRALLDDIERLVGEYDTDFQQLTHLLNQMNIFRHQLTVRRYMPRPPPPPGGMGPHRAPDYSFFYEKGG